jgi:hypothetical protein
VLTEALALDSEHGDLWGVTVDRYSLALVSLRAGRPAEARDLLSGIFDHLTRSGKHLPAHQYPGGGGRDHGRPG